MPIERINPPNLMPPFGYSQVVVASGARTLYLAGQGAFDAGGKLVGEGDLRAQTRQATENVIAALAAAGATPSDLVKKTVYVVGLTQDKLGDYARGVADAFGDAERLAPAETLVGVERLALDGMLIEIEAVAVLSE